MGMRVSIGVIDPLVSVSYQLPVTNVSYILLAVDARLDPLNKNPYLSESFAVVDAVTYEAVKTFSNAVATADQVRSIDTAKTVIDTLSLVEFIEWYRTYIRDFGDSVSPDESKALSLAKGTLSESVVTSDNRTAQYDKARTETLTVADSKSLALDTSRSETLTVDDFRSLLFERGDSELISISESDVLDFEKLVADGVGMNDQAEANDGFSFGFATSFSNVAFAEDSDTLLMDKGLSDSQSVEDTGSLFNQGYCDVTYFAEEYVGDSRTFT